jgi:hypothetical protein
VKTLLLLTLVFAASCTFYCNKTEQSGGTPAAPATETPIDPDHLTFEIVQAQVFKPMCMSCHNTTSMIGGYSLSTRQEAMDEVKVGDPDNSLLYYKMVNKLMPPNGSKPTDAQILLVKNWIVQGAK